MNIIQRLKDGANRATEKAQGTLEVNKLNSQIAEVEKEMGVYFMEMGKVFYEGYRSEDMTQAEPEMMDLSKNCDRLQEEIDELRGRIAELKNERLCKCGHVANLNANFCPACGRKLVDGSSKEPKEPVRTVDHSYEETIIEEKPFVDHSYSDNDYEKSVYPDNEETGAAAEQDYEYASAEDWDEMLDTPAPDSERERRQAEDLERERERQLELDRRIRYWKDNNGSSDAPVQEESTRDTVKCQICRADLPKGSKWCPRCGAEQI